MNKQKGIASVVVMVAMLVMAVALPITTKLVQQSQENRSSAASNYYYYLTSSGSCVKTSSTYASLSACQSSLAYYISTGEVKANSSTCYSDKYCSTISSVPATTYTCSAKACSANYGCMRNGVYTSSTADCSTPIGTVTRTYDASCPKRYGAGGGNDNACPVATPTVKPTATPTKTPTTYTCSAKACSANYGCMRNGVYTSSTADCSTPIGTVTRTYDVNCPKRNGAGGGNDDACQSTTYTCSDKACSANYGCMRNGVYTSSTADCSTPIGTVSRTYDVNCPKRNGAGGGNDDACQSTTYTCSDKACSANYGCMRNGVYTSSTADCSTPIGTVSRTYDVNCPPISDDVLATLGSSGNNDACKTVTACTANDKQCSGNVLQKCNSDGTAWETDTDCGELGCDAANKVCNATPTTCDDIPESCKDKDFTAYKAKGDFNCNEVVDIIDFNIWKGWYNADKEQCGSLSDFSIWKDAFNKSN